MFKTLKKNFSFTSRQLKKNAPNLLLGLKLKVHVIMIKTIQLSHALRNPLIHCFYLIIDDIDIFFSLQNTFST